MCGIAGYKVDGIVNGSVIKGMVGALFHRGPDADGYYSSGPYCAGMRRLMINDLKTGNQPLFSEDKNIVLFYNGEIYNSGELRKQLELKGHYFKTHSDGEVICHLYEEYGERLFEKLDGMFAVALWVENKRKLILARDIPGEKPLYFSRLSEEGIVFASEIKSLKLFPGLELNLDFQAIWDFPTFLWIPEPRTIYKSIEALLPGHILIANESGISIERYINSFNKGSISVLDSDVIRETRRVVEEAVVSRLLSDVPLGCFLSSGLDSSIVATLAARSVDKLSTFTIRFENIVDPYHGYADESEHAESYSKKIGTKHHTVKVGAKDLFDLLDTFCDYADQPFAVSSGLGVLVIAKAARENGIKVLLSGDGADENFGGYSWYYHLLSRTNETKHIDDSDKDISFQNFGMDLEERLKIISTYTPQRRAWAWHYYASENEKSRLFSSECFKEVQSSLRFFYEFNPAQKWTAEDYIRQDKIFYLPNEMLRKVDRMTMAYSVEGRSPFVAPSVLSHSDKLRYAQLVKDGNLKWVLRKAFADLLPQEIINRPKHGFNVPIDHWLNDELAFLVKETFSKSSLLYKNGIIHDKSAEVAQEMLQNKVRFNGHTIFTFVMLNRWLAECN